MAWSFGDSFDLYANGADAANGYWDSGVAGSMTFSAGRFSGSRSIFAFSSSQSLTKSSGQNDPVHHFVFSHWQATTLSGTLIGHYFELFDGATAQCTVGMRGDGAIVLLSGGSGGTTLAAYTGAVAVINTWYAFEVEVVIHPTAGSIAIRKNGNPANDFFLGGLNTRPTSANSYANKLTFSIANGALQQSLDDFFWQSGAATGNWLGDIRCYARMPVSDQSVTFSKLPATFIETPYVANTTQNANVAQSNYVPFLAAYDATVGAATVSIATGWTGNLKCSVFNDAGGLPGTIRSSATTLVNPAIGSNAITFPTPFSIAKGTQYWIGFSSDTTVTSGFNALNNTVSKNSTAVGYSTFPVASPVIAGNASSTAISLTLTVTTNNCLVNEAQEDGLTSYVFDSNPGDQDFYNIASIASTPAAIIATTVRAYAQKSDAGTRTAAVQLKSGAATVISPTVVLTTSGFLWMWRTDLTDPNTGAAWTPAAVNGVQIGPKVIA